MAVILRKTFFHDKLYPLVRVLYFNIFITLNSTIYGVPGIKTFYHVRRACTVTNCDDARHDVQSCWEATINMDVATTKGAESRHATDFQKHPASTTTIISYATATPSRVTSKAARAPSTEAAAAQSAALVAAMTSHVCRVWRTPTCQASL